MSDADRFAKEQFSELERRLEEAERESRYYRKIAEETGKKRLREIDYLSKLISEQKRAQEKNAKLEAQLQQTQKMEALGTMAAGVAHDLNNVLSAIVGYPDLLLMQLAGDSPLRAPISTIQESGKKAVAIVQDLLTFARRGAVSYEIVNLNTIISEYLKSPEYEKLLSFHPAVEVKVHLDPNLLNLSGSPVHLFKVIMNLVSNASEAITSRGEIHISTFNKSFPEPSIHHESKMQGKYVGLSVSDTGTGISPEDQEKIYDPFFTKKKLGRSGTGLGLTVVWGTVKDHNGSIEIDSTIGKGTTFNLFFPTTAQQRTVSKTVSPLDAIMGHGETILVIDDIPEQREIASALLENLNYRVTTVSSGEQALDYLKNHAADLVIIDMIMDPGMDGLETYRHIIQINPQQKAIIASGYSESTRVKEARSLGIRQYLQKPYTLEDIGNAMRMELGKSVPERVSSTTF